MPGVSFVVLLATLGSVGIPLEGLAFIAGVDRIMDMARTALNVIGNALAVLVISKWEGMYDAAKGQRYWDSLPHLRQAVGEARASRPPSNKAASAQEAPASSGASAFLAPAPPAPLSSAQRGDSEC